MILEVALWYFFVTASSEISKWRSEGGYFMGPYGDKATCERAKLRARGSENIVDMKDGKLLAKRTPSECYSEPSWTDTQIAPKDKRWYR